MAFFRACYKPSDIKTEISRIIVSEPCLTGGVVYGTANNPYRTYRPMKNYPYACVTNENGVPVENLTWDTCLYIYETPGATGGLPLTRLAGKFRLIAGKCVSYSRMDALKHTYIPMDFKYITDGGTTYDCWGFGFRRTGNTDSNPQGIYIYTAGSSVGERVAYFDSNAIDRVDLPGVFDFGTGKDIPTTHVEAIRDLSDDVSPIKVTYDNKTILSTSVGAQTFNCKGLIAKTDIVVKALENSYLVYRNKVEAIPAGKTAVLNCANRKFYTDVELSSVEISGTYVYTASSSNVHSFSKQGGQTVKFDYDIHSGGYYGSYKYYSGGLRFSLGSDGSVYVYTSESENAGTVVYAGQKVRFKFGTTPQRVSKLCYDWLTERATKEE